MDFDDLTPAQRTEVERLVGEANRRHRERCSGIDRAELSRVQALHADDLREAYRIGRRAKEETGEQ